MDQSASELITLLETKSSPEPTIVVMPHFCIDNFVYFEESSEAFVGNIQDIASQGGGNLAVPQNLKIGGKAANLASALGALGLQPFLVARTDEMGYGILKHHAEGINIDISHVKTDGSLAFTTAIELREANIMLSDPGSLAGFGPQYIMERDIELIKQADFVCISDWGLNDKGTELARYVFGIVKTQGRGRTYFDPGDPSPKKEKADEEIDMLKKQVLEKGLVDILSVNEDEVERYGGLDELVNVTRIDLHAEAFSASCTHGREYIRIPTFDVVPRRLTGAGDAWNAGDIFGESLGLTDEMRLLLANAAAGFYISEVKGKHPGKADIMEFLKSSSFH